MLPQKNRLPAKEFRALNSKTILLSFGTLKFSRNRGEENRFGFIISNSALKKAVDRHYWKRRLGEFVRAWPNIACDVLVIISPRITSASTERAREELKAAFDKIKKSPAP